MAVEWQRCIRKLMYTNLLEFLFSILWKTVATVGTDWGVTCSVPSAKPQNVYAEDKASATEIPLSWESPPQQTINGILRGYFIWYSIIKLGIHEKNPLFPWDYTKKQLPAASNKDTLTGLESYAKYEIRIAAFTSKGYGPIKEISTSKRRRFVTLYPSWCVTKCFSPLQFNCLEWGLVRETCSKNTSTGRVQQCRLKLMCMPYSTTCWFKLVPNNLFSGTVTRKSRLCPRRSVFLKKNAIFYRRFES